MALKTNLVALWEFAEASGNRADSSGNAYTLTDTRSVGSTSGKFSQNAAVFVASSTDYFELADNANLSGGDVDFSIGAWVRLSSTGTGTNKVIAGKWGTTGNQREYLVYWDSASNRFVFWGSVSGTTNDVTRSASTFGAPASDGSEWCYVFAYHDSVNNIVGISVNDGARDTTAHSTGVKDGTSQFHIGAMRPANLWYMDGDVQQVAVWKEVKTTGDVSAIYNSGSGLAYSSWDASTVTGPLIGGRLVGGRALIGGRLVR